MAQQRGTGANNNYKIFSRIRPIEYQSKMIECGGDNTVSIRDPSSKQKEKQAFQFNGVFDSNTNQETIWAHVCEPCIQKVIEGHNSCILSYGQTGSGKSFTIFGEDERFSINQGNLFMDGRKDRRGLVPRTVEHLFRKAQELEDIREFVITCSMTEIYLDQVRDLGKAYFSNQQDLFSHLQYLNDQTNTLQTTNIQQIKQIIGSCKFSNEFLSKSNRGKTVLSATALTSNFENENLTIYENTNGQIVIKDLTLVHIKQMTELYEMISSAYQLREKFDTKSNQIWARAHTIFTINVVQKDRENENIPFMNSTIQFVDLAGSERIAKSLTEGHKFQEAILINTSLTALGKCLQNIARSNKSIPYRESRMTRVLQNCMGISCYVTLIVNLNPSESNYEESLSSLQFAERTKITQSKQSVTVNSGGMTPGGTNSGTNQEEFMMQNIGNFAGNDKLIKSLKDQIKDLETKIDFIQRENKSKMTEIQNILGLEVDLDKILSRSSQKDLQQFKLQREAVAKLENIQKQNKDLEEEIQQLHKHIENIQREEALKQERQSCQIIELRSQVTKLKEQLSKDKMNNDEEVRKIQQERELEIKQMIEKSNQLLEEKASMILNLPNNVQNKTNENQKVTEIKRNTRTEVEKEFKIQIDNLRNEYTRLYDNMKTQYEFHLKQKNEEIEKYIDQMKKYKQKKKSESEILKKEIIELYDIWFQQNKIIQKIEIGHYSGGKKSFNIPSRDKPNQPNRTSFQLLFKLLDQRLLKSSDKLNKSLLNNNNSLLHTNGSNVNVTFGGLGGMKTENFDATDLNSKKLAMSQYGITSIADQKKQSASLASKTFQSTLLASQAFKSSFNPNFNSSIMNQDKNNVNKDQQQDGLAANKSAKELKIITDVNVDLSVNLAKIKTKEEFPQLKIYAERLKDSLHAALVREKDLKERVQEFEKINNNIDIKAIINERDEFKQLYMQEMRKNNSMSRGSSSFMEQTQRKFFVTGVPNQTANATHSNGFYKQANIDQYNSTNNLSRPQTNQALTRYHKSQDRQLLPLFK